MTTPTTTNSHFDAPPEWVIALTENDLPVPVRELRSGLIVSVEEAGGWARQMEALDAIEAAEKVKHRYRLDKIAHERKRLEWLRPAVTATVKAEVERLKAIRKSARKELEFEFEDSEFGWAPQTSSLKLRTVGETIEYDEREEGEFFAWDAMNENKFTRWKPHLGAMTKEDYESLRDIADGLFEAKMTVTVEVAKTAVKDHFKATGEIPPGWRLVPAHDAVSTVATFKAEEGGLDL